MIKLIQILEYGLGMSIHDRLWPHQAAIVVQNEIPNSLSWRIRYCFNSPIYRCIFFEINMEHKKETVNYNYLPPNLIDQTHFHHTSTFLLYLCMIKNLHKLLSNFQVQNPRRKLVLNKGSTVLFYRNLRIKKDKTIKSILFRFSK